MQRKWIPPQKAFSARISRFPIGLALVVAISFAQPAFADDKISIAIIGLKAGDNISADVGTTLTSTISESLDAMSIFRTITENDIAKMLALDSLKQQVGCDEASCFAEVGGAVGADYMITGSILRLEGTYLLQLQLMDIAKAAAVSRESTEYKGGPMGLLDAARTLTKKLMRPILSQKSGQMALTVSEEGATVKLNEAIIGTSPLATLEVPGGVHTLTVEKEGFIFYSKDIEVQEKETLNVEVQLIPSAEYVQAYESKAKSTRLVAYVSLGVGLAGVGAGGYFLNQSRELGPALSADIDAYAALPDSQKEQSDESALKARAADLTRIENLVMASGILGVAGLGIGTILFAIGDDPGRFDDVHTTTKVADGSKKSLIDNVQVFAGMGSVFLRGEF